MNISQQFSPPLKLIAPFFIVGIGVLLVSVLALFGFDIAQVDIYSHTTLAWVHLFVLGFVMMVIMGAMAQLIPVVLEVEHVAVELYYAIYSFLFVGLALMVGGFYALPSLLPFGGLIVLISFLIYLAETFLTMRKIKRVTFVVMSVFFANIFLLLGLIVAFMMALGYVGMAEVAIQKWLKVHVYFVLFGYVGITVMGMSLILLPMFLLSHIKSWRLMQISLGVLVSALLVLAAATIFELRLLEKVADWMVLGSFVLYGYEIVKLYKNRMRIESDIYFKSMVFSYGSFFTLLVGLVVAVVYPMGQLLLTLGWIAFSGFVMFLISGHLYKIVPFLVWYEKYSQLVGKENVPMLADMVPTRSAAMQFVLSSVGVVVVALGIFSMNDTVFKSGVSFLVFGILFLVKDIIYMMRYK
ncbi:MAG: hypothetical protein FAF05_06930 [Epsilonproteobacteria bacterium]|nr:hypothetical protein [Campylobacterota bacterium]